MGTIVGLIIVFGIVGLSVNSMRKDKKKGKSLQCGQDCSHCAGHCNLKKNE